MYNDTEEQKHSRCVPQEDKDHNGTGNCYLHVLAMPRVETRGSENEEEIAGYRNHVL